MIRQKNRNKGITLLEAVLYLAIIGTILYYVGGFVINSLYGKEKIGAVHDITNNGQYMVDEIASKIGDAVEVNGISQ